MNANAYQKLDVSKIYYGSEYGLVKVAGMTSFDGIVLKMDLEQFNP